MIPMDRTVAVDAAMNYAVSSPDGTEYVTMGALTMGALIRAISGAADDTCPINASADDSGVSKAAVPPCFAIPDLLAMRKPPYQGTSSLSGSIQEVLLSKCPALTLPPALIDVDNAKLTTTTTNDAGDISSDSVRSENVNVVDPPVYGDMP